MISQALSKGTYNLVLTIMGTFIETTFKFSLVSLEIAERQLHHNFVMECMC